MKKKIYGIILVVIFGLILQNKCFCREYQIDTSNVEQELDFWNGWKLFHYGETTVDSKKGDVITYYTPVIVKGEYVGNYKSEATMRGYGYYSFDFNKHIVSLLSYMKNKITNYDTDFKPKNSDKESGLTVRDAIDNTINNILLNWYSKEYEEGEFSEFWTKCISNKNSAIKKELKKLQNNFYFEAYAKNAIEKLESLMGEKFSDLTDNEVTALRGVVFSIMEARYRNKNFKGKTNFKLKVEEGDLIPFLVSIKNLNKITRNTITGKYEPKIEFPDFDEMIDGAYQYMYYYDSQVSNSTSHSTVTSIFNYQNETYEELEVDWEGEYDLLTGEKFPYLNSNRELEIFYTKCSAARTLFKKSKENEEGIFGAEEIYDIASETSYSEAMINMKNSMLEFASSVGGDINEVFSGLTEYNIERTYLMAKNIVENEAIHNEYAYYNIGTNVITFTPGIDGNEYLLIDFQKVSLKEPIMKFDGNTSYYTNEDTDGDDVLDRNELGEYSDNDDEGYLWKDVDVTEFIKKMVEAELYGDDTEYKKGLEPHERLNYSTNKKKQVNEVVANVKYNIYNSRQEFLLRHGDDNIVDRKEQVEHYLNLDKNTSEVLERIGNKAESIEYLKKGNGKLQVELYKYKSNPIFVDTDFDGYSDKVELERGYNAKSGLRKQVGLKAQVGSNISINDTMDYRYFYMSNKNYYDELARMSLIMSNAVSNGNGGIETNAETEDLGYINTAMKSIGMQCTYKEISVGKLKTSFVIGHNEVEYYDLKKNIVLIAISNGKDITAYSQFEDYGKTNWSNSLNSNHSKGYEEVSDRIYKEIKNYLAVNKIDKEVVFWVTGYGTGGGVANILSSKLIDTPPVSTDIEVVKNKKIWMFTLNSKKVSVETGMTNVYGYTFGAPNVVYTNDEYIGINDSRYKSIFNVVDANDVSAHMPSTKTGWHKYGFNMILNEKGEKCQEVINEYNLIMENKSRDEIYEKQGNDEKTMKEILEYVTIARAYNDIKNEGEYFKNMNAIKAGSYKTFLNKYYAHYKELESKHSIKNYYDLCKKLLPEHMKIGDGWTERTRNEIEYNPIKEALDTVANWYVNNVYTYQAGSYGAKRYRSIDIDEKYSNDICGRIFAVMGDRITDIGSSIKSINNKTDSKGKKYIQVIYEQEISLEDAKKELRKGTIQNDENKVSYYTGEQYQNEFKHRFEYYLKETSQVARDNREIFFKTKTTENENEKNPTLIYNFDTTYDVDEYIKYEKVNRTMGKARATYKYLYNGKNLNVSDDCSGFAEAVFLKFIKDNQMENSEKLTNLWDGSYNYVEGKAKILDYGFKCYKVSDKENPEDKDKSSLQYLLKHSGLRYGDLICANGHIEFYRDETHSFGWGRAHSDYEENAKYSYQWEWSEDFQCLYDKKLKQENKKFSLSKNDKYVAVYRYEG